MADDVRVTSLPDSGSAEAVALALWRHLRDNDKPSEDQLVFYSRCLSAVRAYAKYDLGKLSG